MKPYVLEDKYPERTKRRKLSRSLRKFFSKKKKVERREKRKKDKKELRDEWNF